MRPTTPSPARHRRGAVPRPLTVALAVLLLSSLVVTLGVHRVYGGDWTRPFLVGESQAGVAGWPIPVAGRQGSVGYDGQFFLALAFDPFLRTPLVGALDDAEYRGHRIAWSLTAWLLGAGDDSLRLAALYLLILIGVSALGFLLADWAARRGASAWWGLPGALGLGSLVCLQRMVGDVLMTALLVAVAVGLARGSRRGEIAATLCFALAVLQKETAILALPLLALPLLRRRRVAALPWLALPLLAMIGWWWYVDSTIVMDGHFSLSTPLGLPGHGFASALGSALERSSAPLRLAKDLAFLALHAVAILLGLGVGWRQLVKAVRRGAPDGLPTTVGLFALLAVFLSANVWDEPWAYARALLPLLTLELMLGLDSPLRGQEGRRGGERMRRLTQAVVLASFAGGALFALRNLIAAAP